MDEEAPSHEAMFNEYVARIPKPSQRYNPPRRGIQQERAAALCGRNVNYILANILKQHYKRGSTINYVFFWEFDEEKAGDPTMTIEDISIFKTDGRFSFSLNYTLNEYVMYSNFRLYSTPIFGCAGFDHIAHDAVTNSHVFPYIVIDRNLILLETYDTFDKIWLGAKLGHIDTLLRGLELIARTDVRKASIYGASYGEKLTYGDIVAVYRPVIRSETESYHLQRRDLEFTSLGFCPMWSTLLLKRASTIDYSKPIGEVLEQLKGIYAELDAQLDTKDGIYRLFGEFYGAFSGGRRRTRRR